MDFVDEGNLAIALAEFIFCIYEDESLLGSNLLSASEDATGVVFHHCIVFSTNNALGDDFFLRDVHVVTFVSLCGRSDDWFWETLVLAHTLREFHATDFATTLLVFSPCATCKDRADDHLYTETFALQTNGDHWVWCSQLPVRTDVCRRIQELRSYLVEYLSLEWDAFWQHNVER
mgnify:CR=1 FL=1